MWYVCPLSVDSHAIDRAEWKFVHPSIFGNALVRIWDLTSLVHFLDTMPLFASARYELLQHIIHASRSFNMMMLCA